MNTLIRMNIQTNKNINREYKFEIQPKQKQIVPGGTREETKKETAKKKIVILL